MFKVKMGSALSWLKRGMSAAPVGKRSVTRSPQLNIVVELAPHEPNDMANVRDRRCHRGRLLRARHFDGR